MLRTAGWMLLCLFLFVGVLALAVFEPGRPDPFTGDPEQDRQHCLTTPDSHMEDWELERCGWLDR